MAKVAFDVQGTLNGYRSARVVALFRFLEARGHEMFVWSFGGFGMANDAARQHKLKATPMAKVSKHPRIENKMDVCVDDEHNAAQVLSAGKMIDVEAIPEDDAELESFVKEYGL